MIPEKNIKNNFSTAMAILAALWHYKEAGKDKLFSHKYIKTFCNDKHKITFRTSISRLLKSNLIKKELNDVIVLTQEGKKIAQKAFLKAEAAIHRAGEVKWDGGWRIILFDIPERQRKNRDHLRKVLKRVGFKEFQRSIWAYPYPVPGFLKELLLDNEIKPHIKFITTNSLEDDSDLKKKFNLN